jgi:thiol:disulfide interchange protein/DsbC/DsbD-like thiol-disulfide interchange protein
MLRRLLLCFVVASLFASLAHAHVKASLVSGESSIQPGRPFHVALRLEHEAHWHTYWVNPGTGYATTLKWTLPAGWTASEIHWPTPIVIKDRQGSIVGNGYEGETLLPVTITPTPDAKPGQTVTLSAKAEWLMCENICIPGDATVELTLPVTAAAPQPNPAWKPKLDALPMPRTPDKWEVSAKLIGENVELTLRPRASGTATLESPHFFSDDGLVQYDKPQTAERSGDTLLLRLPVSDSYEGEKKRLVGVLAHDKPFGGLRIDVVLGAAAERGEGTAPTSNSGTGGEKKGLAGVLALAFVGGLILNLMPCVFPVLGIKILGFVNQAGADRRKVTLHGLVFTAGVLLSFWSLAAVLALLRAGGDELGWGFQLQSPTFVFVLAIVMLVFALSMSGVFEFGLRATAVGSNLQSKSGYTGSFFTGVLATVVATPCSAPFLAPALGAALALPVTESFVVFTAIAVGLSMPYLLLSIFPSAIKMLPRPGAWMETFKQVMAFPLYATVAYMLWVLAGQLKQNEGDLLVILMGLTLIAFAVWWYGHYTAPGAKPGRVRLGFVGGALLFAAGVAVGWPRDPAPTDIVWEPWSAERVAQLRAEGRPIYVDFTARWCFTCQTNKKVVFSSDEVKSFFREQKVATLKGDWTNRDPKITAELARWNRSAVPFNLVYKPGATEPVALPEILTPDTVLRALR